MKIYFAASIRGGREQQPKYEYLVNELRDKHEVLTEHFAESSLTAAGMTHLNDEEIFARDTAWIRESDVVVAELTQPSLGVGWETAYAEGIGKKVIGLFDESSERRLSAMLAGNPEVNIIRYKDIGQAVVELLDVLEPPK